MDSNNPAMLYYEIVLAPSVGLTRICFQVAEYFSPEMKEVYCRTRPKLEAYYSSLE